MKQVERNHTDSFDGFLLGSRYLIMDRDTKLCESFRSILEQADVNPVKLPARSPNLNAYMERFMRSLKSECLNRMIFFGEKPVRRAVNEFLEHYHTQRNHQGLGNRLIEPDARVGCVDGEVECRERLGGLLWCRELPRIHNTTCSVIRILQPSVLGRDLPAIVT